MQKLNELAAEVGAPRIHLDRRAASGPEFDRVKTGLRQGDPQGDPGGIRGGSGSKKGDPRHPRHFKTNENRGIHCMQLALI